MTLSEIINAHPEWTKRVTCEAWLEACAKEAGEYADSVLAEFGANVDKNGEVSLDHLTDAEIDALVEIGLGE